MNNAFENILLAYDNSDAAKVALQRACDVASKYESKITALFTSKSSGDDYVATKKFIEDFAASKSISLEIVEKSDNLFDEAIKVNKSGNFSLIIIPSGEGDSSGFFSKKNSSTVISSTTCPVITIS